MANEIYDELYFPIQQKDEKLILTKFSIQQKDEKLNATKFSIQQKDEKLNLSKFSIKQENDHRLNFSSQNLIIDEHEISIEFDEPLITINLIKDETITMYFESHQEFPVASIHQELSEFVPKCLQSDSNKNEMFKNYPLKKDEIVHVQTIHDENLFHYFVTKLQVDKYFNQISLTANKLKNECKTIYSFENFNFKSTCIFNCKKHDVSNHRSQVFTCDQCSFKFMNNDGLKSHVETTHVFCYTCDICDSMFSLKSDLKHHIKVKQRLFEDQNLKQKYYLN